MSTVVIVGAQWGDEGKGKLVDFLTEKADVVARYQGGHNAGHTVVIGNEKFILHLVPSGILHRGKLCIIGNGTVVDPFYLLREILGLREKGIEVKRNLLLSKSAHLIMPYHMAIEEASENLKGSKKIGTTGRGIGPAYVDKMARTGIRVGDLLYPEVFREKLQRNLRYVDILLKALGSSTELSSSEEIYRQFMECGELLSSHIEDTDIVINKIIDEGRNVLFEGAQGTLLDVDHGSYPYVTSSSSSAGGVCTGLGVGPTKINKVLGVVKAYTTRVGSGPFPTEIKEPLGDIIREKGGEYGATTGRPRRCGWLDIVSLRHSIRVNGITGIAITKLDILDGLETIKVCTSYKCNGRVVEEFPKEIALLESAEPVYEIMSGWSESTAGIREFKTLPSSAQKYIKAIEKLLKVNVHMISTGKEREKLITIKEQF
ncbi:MAG: adenylosuccinate synthase [Nitrospirae bacterium]|nr:adenylosuccinate synthase [Nitrospirota bacterium]